MLRILVNASTLRIGGGIQVGMSFIEQSISYTDINFRYLVSKQIYNSLKREIQNDERITLLPYSPAELSTRRNVKRIIKKIENEFKPDYIYSIGFPSYVKFSAPEIGRYTNPWDFMPEPLPWHTFESILDKLKTKFRIQYHLHWAKNAKYFQTQTELAKSGIVNKLKIKPDNVKVIPNSPNSIFIDEGMKINTDELFSKKNMIFCLAAEYPHKNLRIIPEVASILKSQFKTEATFILTVPHQSSLWEQIRNSARNLNVEECVINAGPLKLTDCIGYYRQAKILFLPTLLEIFSATYLEAMAMMVPIVTSDLDFARDNCGEGAIYYNHRSTQDAAIKIYKLLSEKELYFEMVRKGKAKLDSYPPPSEKFRLVHDWLNNLNIAQNL